jgi:hypothetical protein
MRAKSTDRSVQPNSLPLAHRRIDAQHNDGRHRVPAAEYKITEVLIYSQKDRPSSANDFGVAPCWRNLGQIGDILHAGAKV